VNDIAREYNHLLNPAPAKGDFRRFMGEYRAYVVGGTAVKGKPPSQLDCYNRAWGLATQGGSYDDISATFWGEKSSEQEKMVRFIAGIVGADPGKATPDSVMRPPDKKLSTDTAAEMPKNLRPVKAAPDDANNLDNH
jgi:hypothetical protein